MLTVTEYEVVIIGLVLVIALLLIALYLLGSRLHRLLEYINDDRWVINRLNEHTGLGLRLREEVTFNRKKNQSDS